MSSESETQISTDARPWANGEGIWQITTPNELTNIMHQSIHFGRRITSYKLEEVKRQEQPTLYVYEVTNEMKVTTRKPSLNETKDFIKAAQKDIPSNPFTQILGNQI